jgi:hypothetical protein
MSQLFYFNPANGAVGQSNYQFTFPAFGAQTQYLLLDIVKFEHVVVGTATRLSYIQLYHAGKHVQIHMDSGISWSTTGTYTIAYSREYRTSHNNSDAPLIKTSAMGTYMCQAGDVLEIQVLAATANDQLQNIIIVGHTI